MEEVRNNLPILSVVLVFVALSRLFAFYNVFDIDIFPFLDFGEILQTQFKFFAFSLPIACISILFLIEFVNRKFKQYHLIKDNQTDESRYDTNHYIRLIKISMGIFLLTAIATPSVFSAVYYGNRIKEGRPEYIVHMKAEEKEYKSDTIYVYVGRTKEYIFFYDRKAGRADVFPNDDIKDLKFFATKNIIK